MGEFDRNFMQEMKTKLDVDLLGVASVDISTSMFTMLSTTFFTNSLASLYVSLPSRFFRSSLK